MASSTGAAPRSTDAKLSPLPLPRVAWQLVLSHCDAKQQMTVVERTCRDWRQMSRSGDTWCGATAASWHLDTVRILLLGVRLRHATLLRYVLDATASTRALAWNLPWAAHLGTVRHVRIDATSGTMCDATAVLALFRHQAAARNDSFVTRPLDVELYIGRRGRHELRDFLRLADPPAAVADGARRCTMYAIRIEGQGSISYGITLRLTLDGFVDGRQCGGGADDDANTERRIDDNDNDRKREDSPILELIGEAVAAPDAIDGVWDRASFRRVHLVNSLRMRSLPLDRLASLATLRVLELNCPIDASSLHRAACMRTLVLGADFIDMSPDSARIDLSACRSLTSLTASCEAPLDWRRLPEATTKLTLLRCHSTPPGRFLCGDFAPIATLVCETRRSRSIALPPMRACTTLVIDESLRASAWKQLHREDVAVSRDAVDIVIR